MARYRTTVTVLITVPSSAAATTAVVIHQTVDHPGLAFCLAILAGVLALTGSIVPLSQETIRSWIAHRAEQRRAEAEAQAIKTLFRAATSGPDHRAEDAWRKRQDARAFAEAIGLTNIGPTSLGDAMQITRGQQMPNSVSGDGPALLRSHGDGDGDAGGSGSGYIERAEDLPAGT